MPSILLDRVGHFFASIHPDSSGNIGVNHAPVHDKEARLNLRINATEEALCKVKIELENEKFHSKKWERRAAAASAKFLATESSTDDLERLKEEMESMEYEKTELEHQVNRLNRMLTVAEEQRGIAIARLAGLAEGMEGVQEEKNILESTQYTSEHRFEIVSSSLEGVFQEKKMTIQALQKQEAKRVEQVNSLQEMVEELSLEKHNLEEKVSKAEIELLEREADRCLVSIYGAEKERLMERVDHFSQMAWKVPHLENNNERLKEEIREKKRKLEDMAKLIVSIKMKHDKLVVHAREREQYGESMAQMFADMKKECERLRGERDEKSRLFENMKETQEQMTSKQAKIIESLAKEVDNMSLENTAFQAKAQRLQTKCDQKERDLRESLSSQERITTLLGIPSSKNGTIDQVGLEEKLATVLGRMKNGEEKLKSLSMLLKKKTTENDCNLERLENLSLEINETNETRSALEERVLAVQRDNARLFGRNAEFESEVRQLKSTNQIFDSRMKELILENGTLQSEVERTTTILKRMQEDESSLRLRVQSMEASIAAERENFSIQFAERTNALEEELIANSEKSRIDAENFETQKQSMARDLKNIRHEKDCAEKRITEIYHISKESNKRADMLEKMCHKLKSENEELKEARTFGEPNDSSEDLQILREMLSKSESELKRLRANQNELRSSNDRIISSSTISSDDNIVKRVQELEISLEEEEKVNFVQKKRLYEAEKKQQTMKRQLTDLEETAKEKEMEAEKLRREMESIYSKMQQMACVSIPTGPEQQMNDEVELPGHNEIQEATRREKNMDFENEKTGKATDERKLPAQKRRMRVGVMDNKVRFRR